MLGCEMNTVNHTIAKAELAVWVSYRNVLCAHTHTYEHINVISMCTYRCVCMSFVHTYIHMNISMYISMSCVHTYMRMNSQCTQPAVSLIHAHDVLCTARIHMNSQGYVAHVRTWSHTHAYIWSVSPLDPLSRSYPHPWTCQCTYQCLLCTHTNIFLK
jgi:hypothetical protein